MTLVLARADSMVGAWRLAAAESLCLELEREIGDDAGDPPCQRYDVMIRRARIARARGDSTARAMADELLDLGRSCFPPADVRIVPALVEHARTGARLGSTADARRSLDEAMILLSPDRPPDRIPLADVHHEMGVLLLNQRNAEAAAVHLEESHRLRLDEWGERHVETARSRLYLGILKVQLNRPHDARSDYESAVRTYRELLGTRHPEYLWAMNAYASYLQPGDMSAALEVYESILLTRNEIGMPEDAALGWTLQNLAIIHQELGSFSRAESLYAEAWRIRRNLMGDAPLTARSLAAYGVMLFRRGDYLEARELLEKALDIFRVSGFEEEPDAGLCHLHLGELHADTGDHTTARDYYERARVILGARGRPQDLAASLQGLGRLLIEESRAADAEPLYRAALAILLDRLGNDARRVGSARMDLARCLAAQHRGAEADSLFRAGLTDLEESGESGNYYLGAALFDYGSELLQRGEFRPASNAFERSLRISRGYFEPAHPHLVRCRIGLGRSLAALGETARARKLAIEAHGLEVTHLKQNLPWMTERHALLYRDDLDAAEDLALSLLGPESSESEIAGAWQVVANGRALVLDEIISRASKRESGRAAFQRLAKARGRLANLYMRGAGSHSEEQYLKLLANALRDCESSEKAWAASLPRDEFRTDAPPSLKRLRARLPDNGVLVACVRYATGLPDRGGTASFAYGAFVGRSSGPVSYLSLGSAGTIEPAVDEWRDHLRKAGAALRYRSGDVVENEYFEIGTHLRRLVWDPIVHAVGAAGKVFLVPDGALHLVSFPALPLGPGRYLADTDIQFSILAAERDFQRGHGGRAETFLALGDPDFGAAAEDEKRLVAARDMAGGLSPARGAHEDCDVLESRLFEPLPATGVEARTIAEMWDRNHPARKALLLTGAEAEEGAFKRLAPGRHVLHLATHGFFVGGGCEAVGKRPASPGARGFGLRSGLALSGANRTVDTSGKEDGVLTGEEIGSLDLSRAELVVLSACNSGIGQPSDAEGVFGLRRAFQASGVRSLVMSLWAVRDRAAGAWMEAFYREFLVRGQGTAGAVAAATRSILDSRRKERLSTHPFFWGGFIAIGECY